MEAESRPVFVIFDVRFVVLTLLDDLQRVNLAILLSIPKPHLGE